MTYDAAGSWSGVSDHQANLEKCPGSPLGYSIKQVVHDFIQGGCPKNKIVLGLPVYGRSFDSTDGLHKPFTAPQSGTWENGVFDYKTLPLPGSIEHFDKHAKASYSYDPVKKQLISYDNIQSVDHKLDFIESNELGGVMFWEVSRKNYSVYMYTCLFQFGRQVQTFQHLIQSHL